MGYDRTYSREEIHQILSLSERRLRPTAPAHRAHEGHGISRHTEQRDDPFDRRNIRQDSTFASRKDLILAVEEALHDPAGQAELATLNAHGTDTCRIAINLTAQLGKIKANVVLSPVTRVRGRAVALQGPQQYLEKVQVTAVLVLIDKLAPAASWAPLHIQTAYPQGYR